MAGQIVDASLIAAPRQRSTGDEKKAISPTTGKINPQSSARRSDARWTVKFTKAKPGWFDAAGRSGDSGSIDRGFGFIRKWGATDAAAYEGHRLREGLLDKTNTAGVAGA